jgi:hypothetical protein
MTIDLSAATPRFVWRNIFVGDSTEISWQHSGIDLLDDGRLIYASPDGSTLVIHDVTSGARELVKTPLCEMHDVVSTAKGVWLCDIGHKYVLEDGKYVDHLATARIVMVDLQGKILKELKQPELPAYAERAWSPTGLSVAPNGDVWVADGYSSYLVLHYDSEGNFLESFTGEKSGKAHNCPHTLRCIPKGDSYEIVIADRANKRLIWMEPSGEVTRISTHPALTSPSGITRYGNGLLVTQLHGALVYVGDDDTTEVILAGPDNHMDEGWPNALDHNGVPIAPHVSTDSLIAPHGITSNAKGDVFLTQWLIGGHVLGGTPA